MRKIFVVYLISFCFLSCQKKVNETSKSDSSFKDGILSVTCQESSKSGVCNYLIYKMNCDKPENTENKEKLKCIFTEITQFKLKEKESKTIPNTPEDTKVCMKTDVVPTLEDCVKE